MSLQTWKKEFYPTTACEVRDENWIDVTKHSLQKWIGLREENLKKHGVELKAYGGILVGNVRDGHGVEDHSEDLSIDSSSCSLCEKSEFNSDYYEEMCEFCPLYKYLDDLPCFEENQPYQLFIQNFDVESMIKALEGTVEMLETDSNKQI